MRFILFGLLFPVLAHAQSTANSYHVNVGVARSDNVGRSVTDGQDETIGSVGFDLDARRKSPNLEAKASGDLNWLTYLDDTYDDDLVGNFSGLARVFIGSRLSWELADTFGQGRVDAATAANPENRENINLLTTGPDLTFGSTTRLRIGARYSAATYETSPLDSDRYLGSVAILRSLSSLSEVSLHASRQRVEYDALEYERDQAYIQYSIAGRRTRIGADVGYTRMRTDDPTNGLMVRLEASRRVSPSSELTISVGREISDASESFIRAQDSIAPTAEPFTSEYVRAGWAFARHRTSMGLQASYVDESEIERTSVGGGAYVGRRLGPRMRARIGASYWKDELQGIEVTQRDLTASIARDLNPRLSVELEYQRYAGTQSTGAFAENRAWLVLSYGRSGAESIPVPSALPQ